MKKLVMLLVIALFLTSVTHAAVVVNDGFDDGGRTNGADALDVDWWTIDGRNPGDQTLTVQTDDGSPGIGSGNALAVTHTATDDRRSILANFADVTLANIGESISLSFDFRILSSSNSKEDFRFGLYNSNGTVQTSDDLGDSIGDNDTGYYIRASTGSQTEWSYVYDVGPSSFLGGTMDQLLPDQQLGGLDNESHTVKMILTLTGSGLDAAFIMDEGLAGEISMATDHTDSSVVTTFNEIGFASNDDDIDS